MNKHVVVLVTAPSVEVARQIAEALLAKKAAACVNIIPAVNSIFSWQGQVENDQEVLLVIKSRAELFESRLAPIVQEVHPYEVPEIIALPIVMGSKGYLDWIDEVTS
jgi:periplasmic divalent cation tolerance protein